MLKSLILLSVLFFTISANAQRIYYSKTEGNFLYTQSHIIGQVKDHIIIWKYEDTKPERSQILIYDDRMNILDRVKTGILNFHDVFTIDFVNMNSSFAVIYQYKDKTISFCKIACFDENGNCFKMQTIDSVLVQRGGNNYRVVRSANQNNFVLIKTVTVKNMNALDLQYHLVNDAGALVSMSSVRLPLNDLLVNDLLLDNSNNLLLPVNKNSEGCSLSVYKLNLEKGSVSSTIHEITNGCLANNTVSISEAGKNYFVTAQWRPLATQGSMNNGNEAGLFFWRLDTNFTDVLNDTVFTAASMLPQFFNNETYFKSSSVIFQNDAIYIISAPSYIASASNYSASATANGLPPSFPVLNETYAYSVPDNSGSHSFYDKRLTSNIKTMNGVAVLNNMDPDDKLPSLPSESRSFLRRNTLVTEKFQFIHTADLRLLILKIDESNEISWSKYFDGTSEEGRTSFVNLANILTGNNAVTLLYAVSGEKGKQIFDKVQFTPDGTYNTGLVLSMDLHYTVIFQKGVTINSSAVVFPCMINQKLAFAKVETD